MQIAVEVPLGNIFVTGRNRLQCGFFRYIKTGINHFHCFGFDRFSSTQNYFADNSGKRTAGGTDAVADDSGPYRRSDLAAFDFHGVFDLIVPLERYKTRRIITYTQGVEIIAETFFPLTGNLLGVVAVT